MGGKEAERLVVGFREMEREKEGEERGNIRREMGNF